MTGSTEQMMKFHAECVLLKRILKKRIAQNEEEMKEIEMAREKTNGSDQSLIGLFSERLREQRRPVGEWRSSEE